MVKKLFISLFLCLVYITAQEVFAVPAVPWPVEKTQPDGTKITVLLKGDEKVHWMESQDGYSLMYDAQKYVVYAEQDAEGNMIPSKVRFGGKSVKTDNFKKGLQYSKPQMQTLEQIWSFTDEGPQKAFLGQKKVFVVLMDFSDREMVKTRDDFDLLMNQVGYTAGGARGSVKDFYLENSYSQLNLEVTVAGPYRADNPATYYPGLGTGPGGRALANEAVNKADPDVDFSQFAVGGLVETFHVIFAGYGSETGLPESQYIWSHAWSLGGTVTKDGVRLSRYSCSPELRGTSGTNITYIGVVCHELGHVFGSPDYYDTGSTGYEGSGNWDLMAGGSWNDGGRTPPHINIFQKTLYGWVTPTPLTSFADITNMPPSAQQPTAYTIKANDNGELYVLENRQQVGFDSSVPGHGLLIWHVHPNALTGNGSNSGHPQQLYPVCASATTAIPTATVSSYGSINSAGCPFPGTSGKNFFSNKSTPAMFSWSGTSGNLIAKPITEIVEAGDKTISFKFLDGPTTPVTNLQAQVVNNNSVNLTWTAANHADVLGYKVYRDGVLQYTINSNNTTTYTQLSVQNGTYSYCVTAFYESTESDKVCEDVTVTGGSDTYCLPITNLTARTTLDKTYLNWTAPFQGGWKTYAGSYYTAYGFGFELDLFGGSIWGPEDLKGLDGFEITQIQYYTYENTSGVTYRAQIWEVSTSGNATKLVDQLYTGSIASRGDKTFTLASPIVIDASKTYIIGVETHSKGGYFLSVDGGPGVPGRNWLYDPDEDEWFTIQDVGADNNIMVSAYLSPGNASPSGPQIVLDSRTQKAANSGFDAFMQKAKANKSSNRLKLNKSDAPDIRSKEGPLHVAPTLSKYIIYRDGQEIGESTTNSFEDPGLNQTTTYSYCVSVVYSSGCTSEAVCVEATTLEPVNAYNPAENLQAAVSDLEVNLTWEKPFEGGDLTYGATSTNPTANNQNVSQLTQAIRFTADELKRTNGMQITKVKFYGGTSATPARTYTIQIYKGGNGSTPGSPPYEQPLASYTTGWNEVTLTTPYTIDAYDDLWIAVKVNRTAGSGSLPRPYYSTSVIGGKTNLYHNGTSWSIVNNQRWPISATVTGGSAPDSYKIFRDGATIATVNAGQLSYPDNTTEVKTYEYCVKAIYGGTASDPACISATTITPYKQVIDLQAKVVNDEVTLTWDLPLKERVIFEEGFESGIPATWENIDNDGDGQLWTAISTITPHSGAGAVTSASYIGIPLTPDNWLVTPAITLTENNKLVYYVNAQDATYPREKYGVYISTTDRNINSFTQLFVETMTASPAQPVSGPVAEGAFRSSGPEYAQGAWYERSVDLSTYAGQTVYIAFRHFDCRDEFRLNLDDVKVLATSNRLAVYDVYADNVGIAEKISEKTLTHTGVATGTHNYCVAAFYENETIETEKTCVDATVVELGNVHRPVTNLAISTQTGTLTWDTPVHAKRIQQHNFTGGSYSSVGTGGTVDFDIAARWTPEELKYLNGLMLTKVRFIPTVAKSGCTYSIRVWTGGTWTNNNHNPGQLIIDQEVSAQTINTWNEITLNTAVPIDPTKELWIGLRCNNVGTGRPAPFIARNPNPVTGKGDLMYWGGNWVVATDAGSTLVGNWILDGVVAYHQGLNASPALLSELSDAENRVSDPAAVWSAETSVAAGDAPEFVIPTIPSVAKYIISVDGVEIDETTETNYTYSADCFGASHSYGVTVHYDDGIRSEETTLAAKTVYMADNVVIGVKNYDGTTTATVTTVEFIDTDGHPVDLELGTDYTLTAAFDDAAAGTGKTVTVTFNSLLDADLYAICPVFILTDQVILPLSANISGLSVADKVYDGTINASIQGTPVLSGILPTDDITLVSGKAEFNNKNAGTNKPVVLSEFTLTGADKDNYILSQPASTTANITPASITVSGLIANDKVYDGTTSVTISGAPVLSGVLQGDNILLLSVTAEFEDENAGTNKPVIFTEATFGGADRNNYGLSQSSMTANIEKATPEYEAILEAFLSQGEEFALKAFVGQTLSSIALPEGFAWEAPQTKFSAAGDYTFTATYTPQDVTNYHIITGISIPVLVSWGTDILTPEGGMKVYPTLLNAGEILQVKSDIPESELSKAVIQVFNVAGSLVKQEKVTGIYTKVQMNVAKGTYILRLQDKEVKVIVK